MRDNHMDDAMLTQLMDEYALSDGERLMLEFEKSGVVIPEELDAGCQDLIGQTLKPAAKKPILLLPIRWLRCATAAAAVLVIVLCGTATAEAVGVDVWKIVAKWTKEAFHFVVQEIPDVSELRFDDEWAQETEVTEATLYHEPMVVSTEETAEPTEIPEETVGEITGGKCGDNVIWYFDGKDTLTISGTGAMYDYEEGQSCPWNQSYVKKIKKIVVEEGITRIGSRAFTQTWNVVGVTLPKTVTSIGIDAFTHNTSSGEVHITDLKAWCMIRFESERSNPLRGMDDTLYLNGEAIYDLVIPDGVTCINPYSFYLAPMTSVTIPASVKSIGQYAFAESYHIKSVKIEGRVETIEKNAFSGCSSLAEITLPDGLISIGKWAFYRAGLTSIRIPETVTEIGTCAFYRCYELQEVVLPAGITSIEPETFYECKALTKINLPEGITRIGYKAFSGCISLAELSIPRSVCRIEYEAFRKCRSLKYIAVPEGVTSIEQGVFSSCSDLTSIQLPYGITQIGEDAFAWCGSLSGIALPASVNTIGARAFYQCASLIKLDIPDGVSRIEASLVASCRKLVAITIPASVTYIDGWADDGCDSLKHILYKGTRAQMWEIDIRSNSFVSRLWHYRATGNEVTITADGQVHCSVCDQSTECTEHTWDNGVLTTEPTAEQDGTMTFTCTVCGDTMQQTIPWEEPPTEPEEGTTDETTGDSAAPEETVPPTELPTELPTEPVTEPPTEPESGGLTEEKTEPIMEPTENIEN